MDESPREMRLSSTLRGLIIAAFIAAYTWISNQPAASLTESLLVAAGLQLAVIAIRRVVAADHQPLALYIFEFVADGVTVLLFALGIFGGILKVAMDV
jgi:hypothetical protein